MSDPGHTRLRVADCLAKCADAVESPKAGLWRLAVRNGSVLPLTARIDDDWLLLDAPLGIGVPSDARELLALNGRLQGAAKVGLPPGSSDVHLRAELPLDDEDLALAERLRDALAGFTTALAAVHGEPNGIADDPLHDPERLGSAAPDLARLCTEADWSFDERAGGRVAVGLESAGGHYQALVEPEGGDIRVFVDLGSIDAPHAEAVRAVELLLLTVSGVVRLARAALTEGEPRARFEVRLPASASSRELGHSLSALSVACGLCAREVRALQDLSLARAFLAARGLHREVTALGHGRAH